MTFPTVQILRTVDHKAVPPSDVDDSPVLLHLSLIGVLKCTWNTAAFIQSMALLAIFIVIVFYLPFIYLFYDVRGVLLLCAIVLRIM